MTGSTSVSRTEGQLPFFVYGTLRPGECNHELFLQGRTAVEEPARLVDAVLYEGPGYPYAVDDQGGGTVAGEVVTAAEGEYGELLAVLDHLEEYVAPGHPRNLYERVARDVVRPDGTAVRAWVYVAAPSVAGKLRATGTPVPGGDWSGRLSR
ncbi:gamma-glutamylcyclotransferase [Streptomyces sp. NBC_01142]|uniref:gamma-glutamylcyclotransferase family protein n=1 Tax=Streptomyces sp. NBC_01142 TaxID=2975865 RepID=UPI00224D08B5|nr:gamma-glutamylcyclotransferase family protein [Streptomyces sp. NBC_01142]MCX4822912.1 gamma-glutamylcyclotransferase [Streptomyces sp. NBC_01142]